MATLKENKYIPGLYFSSFCMIINRVLDEHFKSGIKGLDIFNGLMLDLYVT